MPSGKKPRTKAEFLLRFGMRTIGVMGLGALATFSSVGAWHMFQKERDATDAANAAKRQLALLTSQKEELQAETKQLATPVGTEAALRSRFGVVKPGEGVIQIVEPQPQASTTQPSFAESFFKNVLDILWPW